MENKKKYNTGFKVPKDYFESLEDKLFAIPFEEKLPKDSGFRVPKDYFNTIEEKVISKTIISENSNVISIFRKNIWYISGAAASLLLVIFFVFNNSTINPDNIEVSEIETYLDNDNLDLETQDIAQLFNEADLDSIQFDILTISEENLENYLLDSLDDTILLTE